MAYLNYPGLQHFKAKLDEGLKPLKSLIGELFSVGDSVLRETDLIETATAVTTVGSSMFVTAKPTGNTRTTGIIDMGSVAGRIYTGRNVYRVLVYDNDGKLLALISGPTTSGGKYVFDFTDYPHRYIRVVALIKFRLDHDLVLGNTIADSSHRGKLINELNTEETMSKRVYLRDGVLGSSKYRMGFCEYTNNGVLLLGGEMRYSSGADNQDISIAFTRSLDQGKTFETPKILFEKNSTPAVTYHTKSCGQFLVDRNTGRIFCFCLREDSNVNRLTTSVDKADYDSSILYRYSDDDGLTWSAEQSIDLRTEHMMIMCPAPGSGITMSDGTLVVPAFALYSDGTHRSLLIYSSDHGTTWTWKGATVPESSNECTVVETGTNGTLLLNCRAEGNNYRVVYTTADIGATWTEHITSGYTFWTPICQANMKKIVLNGGNGAVLYLYSSPFGSGRSDTKILCSFDLINWREYMTITTADTRGYTCMAYCDGLLNIVEEYANEMLTCDSIIFSQDGVKGQGLMVPIAVGTTGARKGQLFYNQTAGALQFVDEDGDVKTIAFAT